MNKAKVAAVRTRKANARRRRNGAMTCTATVRNFIRRRLSILPKASARTKHCGARKSGIERCSTWVCAIYSIDTSVLFRNSTGAPLNCGAVSQRWGYRPTVLRLVQDVPAGRQFYASCAVSHGRGGLGQITAAHDAEVLDRAARRIACHRARQYPSAEKRPGRIIGAINCFYDITEHKRAETAASRLAAVVQSSHDAIVAKD